MRTRVLGKGFPTFGRGSREVRPGSRSRPVKSAEASIPEDSTRTPERIRAHYEIEKELAAKLRGASRAERRVLYGSLYDELYRRVPDHSMLVRKASPEEKALKVDAQMKFLSSFLNRETTFLEIGAGDCALSLEVATRVKQVYAIDVSDEITRGSAFPANFRLCLSDGTSIPVPPGEATVAYSNQLMEHLHPDDAFEQLGNIYAALAPSGIYICRTPNRLNGPHDISRSFDRVATGFHLKEYTVAELDQLFRHAGFSRVKVIVATRGRYFPFSTRLSILLEKALVRLGFPTEQSPLVRRVVRPFLGIWMIGIK